jgi:hypothetical protein
MVTIHRTMPSGVRYTLTPPHERPLDGGTPRGIGERHQPIDGADDQRRVGDAQLARRQCGRHGLAAGRQRLPLERLPGRGGRPDGGPGARLIDRDARADRHGIHRRAIVGERTARLDRTSQQDRDPFELATCGSHLIERDQQLSAGERRGTLGAGPLEKLVHARPLRIARHEQEQHTTHSNTRSTR